MTPPLWILRRQTAQQNSRLEVDGVRSEQGLGTAIPLLLANPLKKERDRGFGGAG